MGDTTPQQSRARLLSHYSTWRDPDGRLVVQTASVRGPVLGCLVPTALVIAGSSLIAIVGNFPGMFGLSVLALLFAAIAVPILVRQGSRLWALGSGSIQVGTAFGGMRRWSNSSRPARAIVVRREIWRNRKGHTGSTDFVFVACDRDSRVAVLKVFNWAGQESRLASGGAGSLARAAPTVPTASGPLVVTTNATLMASVSEAVRELTDVLRGELQVLVTYECGEALQRPR